MADGLVQTPKPPPLPFQSLEIGWSNEAVVCDGIAPARRQEDELGFVRRQTPRISAHESGPERPLCRWDQSKERIIHRVVIYATREGSLARVPQSSSSTESNHLNPRQIAAVKPFRCQRRDECSLRVTDVDDATRLAHPSEGLLQMANKCIDFGSNSSKLLTTCLNMGGRYWRKRTW